MKIGVLGINHKSANLRLREELARAAERRFHPASTTHLLLPYVLLSTCNRTEIYFSSDDLAKAHIYLLGVFRQELEEEFEHQMYAYFGEDCFLHLAKVTSGMDSALLGETEIQGQVKQAYEATLGHRLLPKELHFLFQKCLKIGKEVRSGPLFFFPSSSLEESVCEAIQKEYVSCFDELSLLFVGLSSINLRLFQALKRWRFKEIACTNRSFEKTLLFAQKESINPIPWEKLKTWGEYDIIIFGTKSPHFIATPEHLLSKRKKRLIFDLSMPRNVKPEVEFFPRVTLWNIDRLNKAFDRQESFFLKEDISLSLSKQVFRQISLFKRREEHRLNSLLSVV